MATLPTLAKTWTFDTNNVVNTGAILTNVQTATLGIKNAFKAAGWTVKGSSNGTVAAMDGVDRWSVITDLVFGQSGSATSWIVLENAALAAGHFQLCLRPFYRVVTGHYHYGINLTATSDVAFSGGSTTAAPTSTTQFTLAGLDSSGKTFPGQVYPGPTAYQIVWNVEASSDLECTRMQVMCAGACVSWWSFEKMKNPSSGMDDHRNYVATVYNFAGTSGTGSNLPTIANFSDDCAWSHCYVPSGASIVDRAPYLTCECCADEPIVDLLTAGDPEDSGAWPLCPIGVVSLNSPALSYGRIGELYDMWWGATTMITGSTHPGDGSKQFVKMGGLVIPWDGTAPVIT
jgi:hypothetical protein